MGNIIDFKKVVIPSNCPDFLNKSLPNNYHEQSKIFHPNNNKDCVAEATILMQQLQHERDECKKKGFNGGSYGSSGSLDDENPFDKINFINNNASKIKRLSNEKEYFKLFRYGVNKLNKPNSTDNPTLSLSLFIDDYKKTPEGLKGWFKRYPSTQLRSIIDFNWRFPSGSVRVYLDYYMLEYFKTINPYPIDLSDPEPVYFEDEDGELIKLFKKFNNYIKTVSKDITFVNAYEQFLFYYISASKIYNTNNEPVEMIQLNKEADIFVYKFGGPFIEVIDGDTYHISKGYIGQIVRYICLRQCDYDYKGTTIRRNKHYVWRDGHTNMPGKNDGEIIKAFNESVKNSKIKTLNLIPDNYYYRAPWHSYVTCPTDQSKIKRSAIAGVVQMTNFTEENCFFSKDILYYTTIGMAFLLDDKNEVSLKDHRPYQCHGKLLKDYDYGIEEYIFDGFFLIKEFTKRNIYFPDRFLWYVYRFDIEPKVINNDNKIENLLLKCYVILANYLCHNKQLKEQFTFYDFVRAVEHLRNNPPSDSKEKEILSLILSIYPTKYFMQPTIFIQNWFELWNGIKPESERINDIARILKDKWPIYMKDIKTITLTELETIGITCKSPIINSNIEWCANPYLTSTNKCPDNTIFSGFYSDPNNALQYGIFRNPKELRELVNLIDRRAIKTYNELLPPPKFNISKDTYTGNDSLGPMPSSSSSGPAPSSSSSGPAPSSSSSGPSAPSGPSTSSSGPSAPSGSSTSSSGPSAPSGPASSIIKVLSWNISWGAMTGNPADKSAAPLPQTCSKSITKGLNQCVWNVIELIDESAKRTPYDFVALQEAARWEDIYNNSKELRRMGGYVHHIEKPSELVTFYDINKYNLIAVKRGDIVNGKSRARPYHILYLNSKINGEFYIFINLHNGHRNDKKYLEGVLSTAIDKLNKPSSPQFKNVQTDTNFIDIKWNESKYNLIVAGDFNDHGNYNYWQGLQPFVGSKFSKINGLVVRSIVQPPFTCCSTERKDKTNDRMYGDYILFNDTLKVKRNNYIPKEFEYDSSIRPTSDHLPVAIELLTTESSTKVPGSAIRCPARNIDAMGNITGYKKVVKPSNCADFMNKTKPDSYAQQAKTFHPMMNFDCQTEAAPLYKELQEERDKCKAQGFIGGSLQDDKYYEKYLKYKSKYLNYKDK